MKTEQIAAIRARAEGSSAIPLTAWTDAEGVVIEAVGQAAVVGPDEMCVAYFPFDLEPMGASDEQYNREVPKNAKMFIRARADLLALCAEVERLRAALENVMELTHEPMVYTFAGATLKGGD